MAAGKFNPYTNGLLGVVNGDIDWAAATLQMMMLTSGYTPNLETNTNVSDIVANEVQDADYGRQSITGNASSSPSTGVIRCDCNDVSFGASVTITGKYIAIFVNTGVDSTSKLICVSDMNEGGGSVSSSNGAFSVVISANGVLEYTRV